MKINIIIILLAIVALAAYFIVRTQVIKKADHDSDIFFAKFSSTNHEQIKKYLHPENKNIENDLAIMERHKEAISNFDYKNTRPSVNLMLNKASVDVSWHLTIIFKKKNKSWYISKFDEYLKIK